MENKVNAIIEVQNVNNNLSEVLMKKADEKTQIINGITVIGEKESRRSEYSHTQEDASINFTGPDSNNIGKIAVYLLRKEVFGRILSPNDGELGGVVHADDIAAESEDSFIVWNADRKMGSYLMKYPENYSFFRIVDSEEDVDAVIAMIENYAQHLFELLDEKWPFDIDMLDELEDTLGESFDGGISMKTQEKVLNKLKKTEFKPFREQK
jgi:hypothetical protein